MSPHIFLKLPKILKFLYDKWIFDKKIEINLPELQNQYQELYKIQTGQMDELKIISYIDALNTIHRRMTYFNIVIPLLMQAYSAVLRSRLSTLEIDFNQFDLTLGMDELNNYDPTFQLHELANQYKHLSTPDQIAITSCSYEEFLKLPGIEKFQSDVKAFLKTFGHISDSGTDFSYVPWRENQETLINVIAGYNDCSRSKDGYKKIDDIQLKGLGGVLFKIIYQRARKYRLYREISSSYYIFGVGLYRTFYLALGNHFVSRELIDQPEDIFYLNDNEIREYVTRKCEEDQFRFLINLRKTEMEQFSDMVLPDIIYGDTPPPAVEETEFKLVGTPTSRGYYTGYTRIIKGITEFNNLQQGEILVIPFSDVGWTPLFSKAGAVIAESGGILSHSSIIAREYNIPAVVSVSGAMQLKDAMLVTVDGFTGQVSIHHHENHIFPSGYNQ
jgi:pyruvate,water dikinase